MSNSLQDQLLKSGLINKKNAQKAKKQKHQAKVSNGPSLSEAELAKQRANQQKQAKVERDRALNQARNEALAQKELANQIRQLVETNLIAMPGSDNEGSAYNFTHARKIKRIYVHNDQIEQLSRGQIGIAWVNEKYYLIPRGVAEKIQQRDSNTVVVLNDKGSEIDTDDPYADYKIPDDLMW